MKKSNRLKSILGVITSITLLAGCATTKPGGEDVLATAISVKIDQDSFNPTTGKKAGITVAVPKDYSASVTMNDAHGLVIRELPYPAGKSGLPVKLEWDGKDDSGAIVPDEAYYIKVTAVKGKDTLVHDPPALSGGETFTITNANVDLANGTIDYNLDKNARIMIRAGEKKGILLKSIVHCAPRLKGSVVEYWNGKDADNLLSVKDISQWALVIAGYTLPDNSIITYGNKAIGYRDYFLRRFSELLDQMEFPTTSPAFLGKLAVQNRKTNMHFTYPLSKDFPPIMQIDFPNATEKDANSNPVLRGQQRVMIDIDPRDRLFHRNQQFELCFFIDGKFVSEDEIGYVPYNWIWNTAEIAEGEHVVTVNLASFKDQIGTKSVKVVVKR